MYKVALICGTGASSSFMAVKLKMAINKQGVHITVSVYPESQLDKDMEFFDQILLGPHLVYLKNELLGNFALKGKVYVIPYPIYAAMDGSQLLDFIIFNQK